MTAPAWDAAEAAAAEAGVTLRPLTSLEDADDILRVMIATWGNHQLLPREMLVALVASIIMTAVSSLFAIRRLWRVDPIMLFE